MTIVKYARNTAILLIISLLAGCSNLLNQKDPDVIVTTEPMLTKSEEKYRLGELSEICLLYTYPRPRDAKLYSKPSSA